MSSRKSSARFAWSRFIEGPYDTEIDAQHLTSFAFAAVQTVTHRSRFRILFDPNGTRTLVVMSGLRAGGEVELRKHGEAAPAVQDYGASRHAIERGRAQEGDDLRDLGLGDEALQWCGRDGGGLVVRDPVGARAGDLAWHHRGHRHVGS